MSTTLGARFVMMDLELKKLELCANKQDSLRQVCIQIFEVFLKL